MALVVADDYDYLLAIGRQALGQVAIKVDKKGKIIFINKVLTSKYVFIVLN